MLADPGAEIQLEEQLRVPNLDALIGPHGSRFGLTLFREWSYFGRMVRFFLFITCFVSLHLLCRAEVLSIAHRGDSLSAPENTLASFRSALGKADMVEMDVHVTSDGQLVVMHDSTVDRTTDGTGALASKTLGVIKRLDAGSWFAPQFAGERVPTLAEALSAILPKSTPLIEHKAGTPAAYAAELRRLNVVSNVVVQSFNWSFLSGLKALEPGLEIAALGSGAITPTVLADVLNTGARTLAWEKSTVTVEKLALVHSYGLRLFVWTVDGAAIDRFIDMGVDGIISNDPGRVRAVEILPPASARDLALGLVAYWPLDDGIESPAARRISDACGTNNGVVTTKMGSSPWLENADTKFSGSLLLDGHNGYADIPQTTALDIGTNAVSVSAWVKLRDLPSDIPESYAGIFDSVQDSYVLYLDKSGQELRFKVTTTSGDAARPGIKQSALRTNEWLHIVGTYAGNAALASGQAAIYLNGLSADVHTGPDNGGTVGLTGPVKSGQAAALGRNGTQAAYPFFGAVDDIAVWSRALSAPEVKLLFDCGVMGANLADLLRQPTPEIVLLSCKRTNQILSVEFRSTGEWRNFQLLSAKTPAGPFVPVTSTETVLEDGMMMLSFSPVEPVDRGFFRVAPRQ